MLIRLLLYGIRPTKMLAWFLAIFTIQVAGMLLFFAFGRNRRNTKFFKLKKTREILEYLEMVDQFYNKVGKDTRMHLAGPIKEHLKLVKLTAKSSKSIPVSGNELLPLKNGPATFNAIFNAMETAKHFIHIQYYIFEEGELSQKFLIILERKVKQGVKVRLTYDGIGSGTLSKKYIAAFRKAGIEAYSFLPMRLGRILSTINHRNHRKIVIVDGLVGFTGGINVSDKYIKGDPDLGTWHDMHLQLKGPIVNSLQAVFAIDWSFVSGTDELLNKRFFLNRTNFGETLAQVISSGPDSDFASIHQLYFEMINAAKEYVYITNPYVVPSDALLEALQVSALGGIDVRLMLPANSDSFLVKWSVRSYFENLLEAGVKIFLFQDGFIHSKTIVSDDALTTIGTANLDIRSFEQNYEVNVLVYEKEFAEVLKSDFLKNCDKCVQLDYHEHVNRSNIVRLKEGVAKLFSPVL